MSPSLVTVSSVQTVLVESYRNGGTDDQAITAAISALGGNPGRLLLGAGRTYTTTTPRTWALPSGSVLDLNRGKLINGTPTGAGNIWLQNADQSSGDSNILICNGILDGGGSTTWDLYGGINFTNVTGLRFSGVTIQNTPGSGLSLVNCSDVVTDADFQMSNIGTARFISAAVAQGCGLNTQDCFNCEFKGTFTDVWQIPVFVRSLNASCYNIRIDVTLHRALGDNGVRLEPNNATLGWSSVYDCQIWVRADRVHTDAVRLNGYNNVVHYVYVRGIYDTATTDGSTNVIDVTNSAQWTVGDPIQSSTLSFPIFTYVTAINPSGANTLQLSNATTIAGTCDVYTSQSGVKSDGGTGLTVEHADIAGMGTAGIYWRCDATQFGWYNGNTSDVSIGRAMIAQTPAPIKFSIIAGTEKVSDLNIHGPITIDGTEMTAQQMGYGIAVSGSGRTDAGATAGSGVSVITDASCVATDVGRLVVGTNVPAGTYVGAVTPGTSFTLVSAASGGVAVNTTGVVAGVTLINQVNRVFLGNAHVYGCAKGGATLAYVNTLKFGNKVRLVDNERLSTGYGGIDLTACNDIHLPDDLVATDTRGVGSKTQTYGLKLFTGCTNINSFGPNFDGNINGDIFNDGSCTFTTRTDRNTLTGQRTDYQPFGVTGPTGATTPTRLAGGTAGGPPASGTWAAGDMVVDTQGFTWICTVAGTPGTWKRTAWGYALFTANGTFTVPAGITAIRFRAVGGGGGGAGGGSAAAAQLQVGGGGGSAGQVVDQTLAVTATHLLTITLGGVGVGGNGGALGGNVGIAGSSGGGTSIVDTTASATLVTAPGGTGGNPSAASSTTAVAGGLYGTNGLRGSISTAWPGSGGTSATSSPGPVANVVGGAGGGTATALLGGNGGPAQLTGTVLVLQVAASGNGGTAAGVAGTTATMPGCGGGGGGGGAAGTGAGGQGGSGASGQIELWLC
jgi:hypothetical protein